MKSLAAVAAAFLSISTAAEIRLNLKSTASPRLFSAGERVHTIVASDEAARTGAEVVSRLPDGRVLALAPPGAQAIAPDSKISSVIEFDASEKTFVVLFHPDIATGDAERILLAAGVQRIENPDLLPSQWLVSATEEQIHALADEEEVAYIFPASEQLSRGEPLLGCSGPVLETGPIAQYVATVGQGWDGAGKGSVDLTFSLAHLTDRLPANTVLALVQKAFAEWSNNAALHFRQTADTASPRNLNILFASGAHGDSYAFDGPGTVLAHTFYPAGVNPEPIAGDIHLDEDETWTDAGQPDLYSVLVHEIGHALGLGHSDKPGAVMYPYYRTLTTLQADDVAAIQRIYAAPASAPNPAAPTAPGAPPTPTPPPTTPAPTAPVPSSPATQDAVAPSITITSPASTSYATSAAVIRVAGTSRDNVGVQTVTWQLRGDVGTATGTTTWSADVPLTVGANTIVIRAIDAAGNRSWKSVAVTRR